MYTLIIISLIFFGLVFGSFGSVIFYRLWDWPTKETWKWFLVWRSECPKCHHQLKARNLVPIFSWFFQWWKCEYCKAPISWFYPFLEITTVLIFLYVFFFCSSGWIPGHNIGLWEGYVYMIVMMISAWLLWIILLYDFKMYELHITATIFLAILSLFFAFFYWNNKLDILLWILIFGVIFLTIYCLSKIYVKQKYKKDAEWFWLWDVIISPILWAWLVFFLQPNWIFEWCYLVCLFVIFSSLVWLIHYLFIVFFKTKVWLFIKSVLDFIYEWMLWFWNTMWLMMIDLLRGDVLHRDRVRKTNRKKIEKPYGFKNVIPFLPSMIIWFILEIILREPIIEHLVFNV